MLFNFEYKRNIAVLASSFFSHIYFRNINVYDDIKIEIGLCFSSVVRRMSTNFSDTPRTFSDVFL